METTPSAPLRSTAIPSHISCIFAICNITTEKLPFAFTYIDLYLDQNMTFGHFFILRTLLIYFSSRFLFKLVNAEVIIGEY